VIIRRVIMAKVFGKVPRGFTRFYVLHLLIEEVEGGKFAITPKGETTLEQFTTIQEHMEKQVRLVRRLGLSILTAGKYIAEDAMDRIIAVTSKAKEIVAGGSRELQNSFHTKYRYFLESELERLDEKKHDQTQEAPLDRNDKNLNKV
jgi:hypothetical protein